MRSPESNAVVTSTGQSAGINELDANGHTGERSVMSNIGGHDYQLVSDDDLFGDRAKRVYSFEPSPTTFRYLKKNILSAKLNNVTVVNAGVGAAPGSYELTFSPNNRSGGFVSNHTSASQGHRVERIEIIKGDDFVAANAIQRVDFIKIDVEGFERFVIEGLAVTIARDEPVVTLELNHWCLNAFQRTSVPDFFDFLRNVFPYLYAVDNESKDVKNLHDPNDSYHVMYKHIVFGFKYSNLVGATNKHQLQKLSEAFGIRIN
jgi:FkbM family methyltransferase